MKNIIFSICFFFSLMTAGFAQNKVNFDYDYARFQIDSTTSLLELYLTIDKNSLKSESISQGSSFAEALLSVEIKNLDTDSLVVSQKYNLNSQLEQEEKNQLVSTLKFRLGSGNYNMVIKLEDKNNPERSKQVNEEVIVNDYDVDDYHLSDLQLASNIITGSKNTESAFYKNSLEVIPNADAVYSQTRPILFYYAEVYNPQKTVEERKPLLNISVINKNNQLVYKKEKEIPARNAALVEVGVVNVSSYTTGQYNLVLTIFDTTTNHSFSSYKRFYVYNPDLLDTLAVTGSSAFMSSEFYVMSDEECDHEFNKVKVIATDAEKESYENLSGLEAKRKFLFDFWKKRDPDLSTAINEFKLIYDKRAELVEERFRTAFKSGLKTDRGRVYLQYGEPDEIDQHPNEYYTKPYEIWYYRNIEGGVEFVFGDITGYNDYELLHSTKRGEVRDESWMRRLQVR